MSMCIMNAAFSINTYNRGGWFGIQGSFYYNLSEFSILYTFAGLQEALFFSATVRPFVSVYHLPAHSVSYWILGTLGFEKV